MTRRASYFSHIENLDAGSLTLFDPFAEPRAAALVCRYDLRRTDATAIEPASGRSGAAAFAALAPPEAAAELDDAPLFDLKPEPGFLGGRLPAVHRLCPAPDLPFRATLPAARAHGRDRVLLATAEMAEAQAMLAFNGGAPATRRVLVPERLGGLAPEGAVDFFSGSLQAQLSAMAGERAVWADVSAWGSPYRVESLKLAALTLAWRCRRRRPAVLVADPVGEWTFALLLAAEHWRAVGVEPPFRVILIQDRPCDGLCQQFEGRVPDWSPLGAASNLAAVRPPDAHAAAIAAGLASQMGTAVSLPPAEPGEPTRLERAATLLLRAGFLDEEDDAVLLDAYPVGFG